MSNIYIRLIYSGIVNTPLETISSNKKSLCSKLISGLAIGALTIFSLGLYTIHVYRFFEKKKAINLQKELEQAIGDGDCQRVKELFQRYPVLKTQRDLVYILLKKDSHISLMLPLAAEKGHLDMVKLLVENGATLNAHSRGQKPALERALNTFPRKQQHEEIAKYLVENGAIIDEYIIFLYIQSRGANLDMMIYLLENFKGKIKSEGEEKMYSNLGAASLKFKDDPEKCKKLMRLLIEKGDRLVEGDDQLPIDQQAKKFINQQVKKFRDLRSLFRKHHQAVKPHSDTAAI